MRSRIILCVGFGFHDARKPQPAAYHAKQEFSQQISRNVGSFSVVECGFEWLDALYHCAPRS
jgi:hypothetical protein